MLRILFIGNSHSYFNDMPAMVKEQAKNEGIDCDYDYVVLQEHAHPFGPVDDFYEAVRTLNQWIKKAGSRTVLYMTWAKKDDEPGQRVISEAYRSIAEEVGALLAPVGDEWWNYSKSHPALKMYDSDGAHASPEGSAFAAKIISSTIFSNWK